MKAPSALKKLAQEYHAERFILSGAIGIVARISRKLGLLLFARDVESLQQMHKIRYEQNKQKLLSK